MPTGSPFVPCSSLSGVTPHPPVCTSSAHESLNLLQNHAKFFHKKFCQNKTWGFCAEWVLLQSRHSICKFAQNPAENEAQNRKWCSLVSLSRNSVLCVKGSALPLGKISCWTGVPGTSENCSMMVKGHSGLPNQKGVKKHC